MFSNPRRVPRKRGQDAIVQQLNILPIAAKRAISRLITESAIIFILELLFIVILQKGNLIVSDEKNNYCFNCSDCFCD